MGVPDSRAGTHEKNTEPGNQPESGDGKPGVGQEPRTRNGGSCSGGLNTHV